MFDVKLKTAIVLICMILMGFAASAIAVDYNPGVTVGQWVKYGNFVATGPDMPSNFSDIDWMKLEVVAIDGKNVSLDMSFNYKNGTPAGERGINCNVETGFVNETIIGMMPIIAANLQQGDMIPSSSPSPITINKTVSRTYAGVARTVNILNMTSTSSTFNGTYVIAWDKASGMLMEIDIEMTVAMPTPTTETMSFSAVDTNIFATGTIGWLMDNIIYVVATIIVIIIIIAAILIMRGRKPKSTTQPTIETSTTSET